MKKVLLFGLMISLSGCVMEQQVPRGPGQTSSQVAFHPTLYTSPGAVGGVSKSTYTVTEMNR